jgi:FdhD protein
MAARDKHPRATRVVRAERISTEPEPTSPTPEEICVAEEAPVKIDVEGVETYMLLCTPMDRKALAVGFLYTEGVIAHTEEIEVLKACDDDPNTIRIRLTGRGAPRLGDDDRNLLITSSCGACGSEQLERRIEALPQVTHSLTIRAGLLRTVYANMRRRQSLFDACGGTHAAAVFDDRGDIVALAEDTGRHNALDKAIGKCLLDGRQTTGRGVALTSRLSLEMVAKCVRAGIELVAAVSAPTSMAIDVARRCNITVCAFVRGARATVLTHPERIQGANSPDIK